MRVNADPRMKGLVSTGIAAHKGYVQLMPDSAREVEFRFDFAEGPERAPAVSG